MSRHLHVVDVCPRQRYNTQQGMTRLLPVVDVSEDVVHHAGLAAVLEAVQELPVGHPLAHDADGAAGQEGPQQRLLQAQPELTQHLDEVVIVHLRKGEVLQHRCKWVTEVRVVEQRCTSVKDVRVFNIVVSG